MTKWPTIEKGDGCNALTAGKGSGGGSRIGTNINPVWGAGNCGNND